MRLSCGACLLVLLVVGCGDDDGPMRDGGLVDGGFDSGSPDSGPRCASDEECDDGVDCTRDFCNAERFCVHSVDPAQCDDGVFCNGRELCDPEMGCTAGLRESCNDSDVCTIDRCDEESKSCVHVGRDQDGDGEADFFCPDIGGTDCNDNDPRVGATIREVCDDEKDNDCDERVDEADCGAPAHDTCDDALDVSAGGVFSLSTRGAVSDYRTCAPSGRRDLVLTFTLEEARSVVLRAEGASLTYLSLQTECGDRGSELRCASGFPGEVRSRSLDAGTYFVIVSDIGGDLVVEVDFDEPEPPAPNDVCDGALDVSAGGSFAGSLVEVANDATATCGFGGPELFYTFTLDGPRDVILSATASTGDSMAIGVSQTCFGEELRCARGAPAGTRLHELGAGTYFVAVEGSASREADFTLTVAFEDPTPPPTGDTCAAPLPLTADETTTSTLADKQDDYEVSCSFFFRDAVHRFVLDERSDVSVEADADGPFVYVSVRSTCDDVDSEVRCVSGNPGRARVRNLPAGEHYVLVESFSGTGYDLTLNVTPPTVPVPVTGNDNCSNAYVVPTTGGIFTGNTTALLPDYSTRTCGSMAGSNDATFVLMLPARARVVANTSGSSFDTVLHLHTGSCASGGEVACDDDGGDGSTSYLDRVLEAGTHFLVVDGFGMGSSGEYVLEVDVTTP
ncbi:MAG: hypothetical protein H6720_12255 [Sandaracinus sp.]|nr:hypothetical protein [Sandaracinus sp.]